MIVLGIDPGLVGGCAVVDGDVLIDAIDIPTHGEKSKRRVDAAALQRWIKHHQPAHAFIERAQAFAKQGVSSGFNYGRAVGALEAAVECAGVPLTIIEPSVWKRRLGLPGGAENKEAARQRAIQLYPGATQFERKKDHGRAEAALIARYGMGAIIGLVGTAPRGPAQPAILVKMSDPAEVERVFGKKAA